MAVTTWLCISPPYWGCGWRTAAATGPPPSRSIASREGVASMRIGRSAADMRLSLAEHRPDAAPERRAGASHTVDIDDGPDTVDELPSLGEHVRIAAVVEDVAAACRAVRHN